MMPSMSVSSNVRPEMATLVAIVRATKFHPPLDARTFTKVKRLLQVPAFSKMSKKKHKGEAAARAREC